MRCLWIISALLAYAEITLQQHIARDKPSGEFTTPAPSGDENDYGSDQVYLLNSKFDVLWVTDPAFYSVYLWQQVLPGGAATAVTNPIYTKLSTDPEQGGFSWQVETLSLDLSVSNVFFLSLGPSIDIGSSMTCHYFNITADAADIPSSQSSSSPTATAIGSAQSTTPSPSNPTASRPASSTAHTIAVPSSTSTTTAGSAQATTTPGSFSTGAKIGLGIGLGIGIPIILLLASLLFLKLRKDRRDRRQARASEMELSGQRPPAYASNVAQASAYRDLPYPQSSRDALQRYELPVSTKPPSR